MTMTREQKSNLFYRRRLRFRLYRRDYFKCRFCGRGIADGVQLTLDHLIPKSKGGAFTTDNLVTACWDCNVGKKEDVLSEWEIEDLKKELDYLGAKSRIVLV